MARSGSPEKFKIGIRVDRTALTWPEEEECETDYGLGCNREYHDMRGVAWREVRAMLTAEGALLYRVKKAASSAEEVVAIEQEIEDAMDEGADWAPLDGFDLGVASAVYAISALGCVPFTSCNGGAFGDRHHQAAHPLVAFFAKPEQLEPLVACAKAARCGLEQKTGGELVLYSFSAYNLYNFARELNQMIDN